jgi:DnaJ-class molecular chaperone
MAKDFYSVLDIPSSTSKEEIRQAYLRLAREYHPDVSDDPQARERFEEVHQAYVILSDYEARKYYNLYREGGIEKAAQDEAFPMPLMGWHKLAAVAIIGMVILGIVGILVLCGLMLYASFL